MEKPLCRKIFCRGIVILPVPFARFLTREGLSSEAFSEGRGEGVTKPWHKNDFCEMRAVRSETMSEGGLR